MCVYIYIYIYIYMYVHTLLTFTSKCPLESSNLPGAGPISPDGTSENWPYGQSPY